MFFLFSAWWFVLWHSQPGSSCPSCWLLGSLPGSVKQCSLVQLKRALLDSKNIRESLPLVQVPKPSTDLAPAEAAVCLVAGAGGTTSKICVWTCSLWCLIEMVDLQLWRWYMLVKRVLFFNCLFDVVADDSRVSDYDAVYAADIMSVVLMLVMASWTE